MGQLNPNGWFDGSGLGLTSDVQPFGSARVIHVKPDRPVYWFLFFGALHVG